MMEAIAVLWVCRFLDDVEALSSLEMAIYDGECWDVANPKEFGSALAASVLQPLLGVRMVISIRRPQCFSTSTILRSIGGLNSLLASRCLRKLAILA